MTTERVTTIGHVPMGATFIVEPDQGEEFEAVMETCLGWSLVNGVMDFGIRRVSNGQRFSYGIRLETPVRVVVEA